MKPFVVLALPGMYLFYKYNQYRRQQQEQNRRKVTERELAHLNHKIVSAMLTFHCLLTSFLSWYKNRDQILRKTNFIVGFTLVLYYAVIWENLVAPLCQFG